MYKILKYLVEGYMRYQKSGLYIGLNSCKCTSYIEKLDFNTLFFQSTQVFNLLELYFDQHYIFKAFYNVFVHEICDYGLFLQIIVSFWPIMAIKIGPF